MRFIKLGLFSIVFFFLLLTGMASLLPSDINISRAIDINAPADSVFSYVNNLDTWQKWYGNDDTSKMVLSAKKSGRGASLTINSTAITIEETVADKKIKVLWQTDKNTPLRGEFNFFPKESGSQTTLQWNFTQHIKWYPWEKFASILSNKAVGPFMEKSLEKLKQAIENPG